MTAILLAAGRGERNEDATPKQFLDLAGRPVFAHPLEALDLSPYVESIVVVLPDSTPEYIHEYLDRTKAVSLTTGGSSRQASLARGLECLAEETTVVLVHDAARPLLSSKLISRVLEGFDGGCHGVICALPLDDSIKEVSSADEVLAYRSREGLWRAQTPQAFLRDSLEDSLAKADAAGIECDDCSELLTRAGYRVKVVPGDPMNIKITRANDLSVAESILASRAEARRLRASEQ